MEVNINRYSKEFDFLKTQLILKYCTIYFHFANIEIERILAEAVADART